MISSCLFNGGYFSLKDRFAESTGPNLKLSVASNPVEPFQWNVSIGQDPRTVSGGVNYSVGEMEWQQETGACLP